MPMAKVAGIVFPISFFWVVFCFVGFRGSGRQVEVVYIHGLGY